MYEHPLNAWHIVAHPKTYLALWLGLGAFGVLWLLRLRHNTQDNWLYTLEHELTHALFAVLTLNRVTALNAERGNDYLTSTALLE